jgi:hypothetical protein
MITVPAASQRAANAPSIYGVFVGSTPGGEAVRAMLGIPPQAKAELIEWKLTLYEGRDAPSAAYHLRWSYGPTAPNQPGLSENAAANERRGTWRMRTDSASRVTTYDLGGISLLEVSRDVVHLLAADRSLLVGDGGWSYTLTRESALEPKVDPSLAATDAGGESRTISPVSTGSTVFGVFEGRTPCQRIARELGAAVRPGCWKLKWRVTLYQHPQSRQPGTYKVEGTLYGSGAREGAWQIQRGTPGEAGATVYTLQPAAGQRRLSLLKGDDNVLFFLDSERRPLTGTAGNSYTLDRRQ